MSKQLAKYELLVDKIKQKCQPIYHDYLEYSNDAYDLAAKIIKMIEEVEDDE